MQKPVKLVQVVPQIKVGGVENVALYLLESLNDHIEYHVICLEGAADSMLCRIPQHIQQARLHIVNGTKYSPVTYYKALQILKHINPDKVLYSLWRSQPLLWLTRFATGISTVFLFHNNKFKHGLDRFSSLVSLKCCHTVCADSPASKTFLKRFTSKPINILHHHIKHPVIKAVKTPKSLVYIGRLAKNKCLEDALTLLTLLVEESADWHLDIYGPDEGAKHSLLELQNKLGLANVVRFFPELDAKDVPICLAKYQYLVQPSRNEGMAMVVLEAMAQGLIPIVRPVGQIKYYTQDQQTALWIPNQITKNFASLLTGLDNNAKKITKMQAAIKQQITAMPNIIDDFVSTFCCRNDGSKTTSYKGH